VKFFNDLVTDKFDGRVNAHPWLRLWLRKIFCHDCSIRVSKSFVAIHWLQVLGRGKGVGIAPPPPLLMKIAIHFGMRKHTRLSSYKKIPSSILMSCNSLKYLLWTPQANKTKKKIIN